MTIAVDLGRKATKQPKKLPAIVADMNCEVVLGVDFMQKFSCVLDKKKAAPLPQMTW